MAGDNSANGSTYTPWVGLVYIFNLIVGTGALTLPAAFSKAGWLVSLCFIVALGIISYMTLTFVVESMAVANAVLRSRLLKVKHPEENANDSESSPDEADRASPTEALLGVKIRKKCPRGGAYYSIIQPEKESTPDGVHSTADLVTVSAAEQSTENCDIKTTVEMGSLAGMFFNKTGNVLFFICIAVYLYGDLAIYEAAVGNSLRDVACTYKPPDYNCSVGFSGTELCWEGTSVTRNNAYRLFLSIFVVVIGTFGFFNVQKTMLLQILTTIVRWTVHAGPTLTQQSAGGPTFLMFSTALSFNIAFIVMIALACIRLATKDESELGHPPIAAFDGIPNLFGACIYSFMCHHSLPSLVTPISPKRGLYRLFMADYILIGAFYLLLGFTGIFAFQNLKDLYTLNFVPECPTSDNNIVSIVRSMLPKEAADAGQNALFYFLALFPVFTLSTSFPIITITLRNNLKQLFLRKPESEYSFFWRRLFFPLLALVPPTIIAIATSDVQLLVGITGSYAGAGVQYIVPALLAYYARKELLREFPEGPVHNMFSSPFKHVGFVIFVLAWSIACIGFVTYNHIVTGK